MKTGKILGKELKLSNEYYNNLVERFNYENAVKDNGVYTIEISCKLCEKYRFNIEGDCGECPFKKFEINGSVGCVGVIREIIKSNRFCLKIRGISISWLESDDKLAKKILNKIRNKLLKMKGD